MRGQVQIHVGQGKILGITPADAGTSLGKVRCIVLNGDHPRGCGDKLCLGPFIVPVQGSPPRMRGQGITPADAGTSSVWVRSLYLSRDHPRGCGDKGVFVAVLDNVLDHPRGCGDKTAERNGRRTA